MLKSLAITNVAVIEKLQIDFESGLNVLSGETGAGKSIIIDSLNFVLGAKADKTLIRSGKDFMQVDAVFEISDREKFEIDIEEDNLIILSRRFFENGKSEIKVNGSVFSLGMLKEFTALLIDVYGQSEHVALLKDSNHQKFLDGFASRELQVPLEKYSELLAKLKDINLQLNSFGGNEFERKRLLDIYAFQIEEIENAKLKIGEEEELLSKKNLFANAEKITKSLKDCIEKLSRGDFCAIDRLGEAKSLLMHSAKFDESLQSDCDKLADLKLEIEDINGKLEDYISALDFDEQTANAVFERLDFLKQLKKKYGADVNAILEYCENTKIQFEKLSNCEEKTEKLQAEKNQVLNIIYQYCMQIHDIRQKFAQEFEKRMQLQFDSLALKNSKFHVEFEELCARDCLEENLKATGIDSIKFLFSANEGEDLRPLSKVASGGEMSRLMLAIKQVAADVDDDAVQVYDEIDSGMSGHTVLEIAKKLSNIAKFRQLLCISHSAGIIAIADHNFLIEKHVENGKTISTVTKLDENGKLDEISRLLSSVDGSKYGKMHAEELLEFCKQNSN